MADITPPFYDMSLAQNAEARHVLSSVYDDGTPIAFPATSMHLESVDLDFYDNLPYRYDECTLEELLYHYGIEV